MNKGKQNEISRPGYVAKRTRLIAARVKLGLSQEALAEQMDITKVTICHWENAQTTPYPYYKGKLCTVFDTDDPELLLEVEYLPTKTRQEMPSTLDEPLASPETTTPVETPPSVCPRDHSYIHFTHSDLTLVTKFLHTLDPSPERDALIDRLAHRVAEALSSRSISSQSTGSETGASMAALLMGQACTYALLGEEGLALDARAQAKKALSHHPEFDPISLLIPIEPADLDRMERKVYLILEEKFPEQGYGQKASETKMNGEAKEAQNTTPLLAKSIENPDSVE